MSRISLYEDHSLLKEMLMNRFKSYRNFSVKFSLLFFMTSFVFYYSYTTLNTDHLSLIIEEVLYKSCVFSLTFAIIGYCAGAVMGTVMQKQQVAHVAKIKQRKKEVLQEQIAIRKAKLETL